VSVFNGSVLDYMPKDQYLDMPTLMMNLKNAKKTVATFRSECEWLDIGRADDYQIAVELFEASREKYLKE